VNIYGPNLDCPLFFEETINNIANFDNATIIICGDWNVVLNYDLDTYGCNRRNKPNARLKILGMMEDLTLVDIYRINNPNKTSYTWRSSYRPVKMSRLDYFLITEDIHNSTKSIKVIPGYRSDHSIVSLTLQFRSFDRGQGIWKLNTSLLVDNEYKNIITNLINEETERYKSDEIYINGEKKITFNISNQLFFDILKMSIRGRTIAYSSTKNKNKNLAEKQLEKSIQILEDRITTGEIDPQILDELEESKEQLKQIRNIKMKGIMVRARAKYYEEGEKPTKYFLNLEKRNYVSKLITRLNTETGEIKDSKEILQTQKEFYKQLYSTKRNENNQITDQLKNTFLREKNIKLLNKNEKDSCEENITEDEVKFIIKNMKNNKTPGNDGIPVEFYKIFWKKIGKFLMSSINEAFIKGELSITQKQGVITCIPKGDKPKQFLQNWRPISLLNVDYKILSGVLANRMKMVLPSVINPNQKGFLKDRYIGENTRLVYDIIAYLNCQKQTGIILLADFEKAFDTLEWDYIKTVLAAYNFGPNFIKWFNILYKDSCSCVINNGTFSTFST